MKKMKRLVAVLLAGIMALAMLTACGGGSSTPTSDVEKAEALYMDSCNTVLDADADYENDAELKNQAKRILTDSLDENGVLKSGQKMTVTTYDKDAPLSAWTTVTILAQTGNENVPYGITSEELALANKDKANADVRNNFVKMGVTKETTTRLAVGAVQKGDKIYVAIAVKTERKK